MYMMKFVANLLLVGSSCLEWRAVYPLLEEAGAESWAIDILGWGFSNLGKPPQCRLDSSFHHHVSVVNCNS